MQYLELPKPIDKHSPQTVTQLVQPYCLQKVTGRPASSVCGNVVQSWGEKCDICNQVQAITRQQKIETKIAKDTLNY